MATKHTPEPGDDDNPELTRFARSFTSKLTAFFDTILGPFLNPSTPAQREPAGQQTAQDWAPEMPYRPESPGVHTVLTGVVLVLRDADPTTRHLTVTAFPADGGHHGADVTRGDSMKLDAYLPGDLPQDTVDAYMERIEMWAMTETPLVLIDRDDDPLVLVNDQNPSEWLPVEL